MPDGPAVTTASPPTTDGSVVEVFRKLSSAAEIKVLTGLIQPGSSVLDLGAGVGRIANPLTELGYSVTAVDDSIDMLAHVRCTRIIQARIEKLRLPEQFGSVLLLSSLINLPGEELRRGLVATVARHLAPAGKAIIQWTPGSWFDQRPPGSYQRQDGHALHTITVHSNDGERVVGEFRIDHAGAAVSQSFEIYRLSGQVVRSIIESAGMQLHTNDPDSSPLLEASLQC